MCQKYGLAYRAYICKNTICTNKQNKKFHDPVQSLQQILSEACNKLGYQHISMIITTNA